jgi:hypothetical protein
MVNRHGYGGQQDGLFVMPMGVPKDLKHTKANFMPNSIDMLCLWAASISRFGDFCVHNNDSNRTNYITPCISTENDQGA